MTNQPKNTSGAKPAVPHKKNFLDDRRHPAGHCPFWGAIVAWMIVTIIVQPGTTNTIYNVPVDYTYDSSVYTSRGLSIVSAEDKTVNLKISGDGYTIGSLTASDFVVYPDWSSVRDSGEKRPAPAGAGGQRHAQWRYRDHRRLRQHGGRGVRCGGGKDPSRHRDHQLPGHLGRVYPLQHRGVQGYGHSVRPQQ